MKKIIALLFVLFLIAACGNTTTGNSVKDTTGDGSSTSTTVGTCGDKTCESSEMCNPSTLKAVCVEDCGPCPSYLYTKGFDCGSYNCQETSDNTFEITGTSDLKLDIYNLGEVLANTLEINSFKCYDKNQRMVSSTLLANYNGIIFTHGFDNGKDEVRLTAKGSNGDRATYRLKFEEDNKREPFDSPFELKCNVELKTHNPMQGKDQTVYLNFKPQ